MRARARRWTESPEHGRSLLEAAFCSTILLWLLIKVLRDGAFATDFRFAFWPAGRHVLEGTSPFSPVVDFFQLPFVYPAPAALLFVPFGLLPRALAEALFTLLLALALVGALRLCRVRDPRCYVLAFLWAPVFSALQTANLTLLLVLGVAAVWRLRDRLFLAAAVAAGLISLKIFFWPILVWLGIFRGLRAAAASALMTAVLTLASWAVIGFAGFSEYPHLVQLINREEAGRSYSVAALAMRFGLSSPVASALTVAVGLGVLALAVIVGRREGDERRSFALTVLALILCSPVVWLHYYALLVVAIALLRPRVGPMWFLPLLLWPCPVMLFAPTLWPLAPLAVSAAVVAVAAGPAARRTTWAELRTLVPLMR
jgi:hypothetical protein